MPKMKRSAVIQEDQCVACGSCVKVCPRGAISVPYGIYAVVDKEACVGCGLCEKACPASVIHIEKREEVFDEKQEKVMV